MILISPLSRPYVLSSDEIQTLGWSVSIQICVVWIEIKSQIESFSSQSHQKGTSSIWFYLIFSVPFVSTVSKKRSPTKKAPSKTRLKDEFRDSIKGYVIWEAMK